MGFTLFGRHYSRVSGIVLTEEKWHWEKIIDLAFCSRLDS